MSNYGGSIVFDKVNGVGGENSRVAVITKLADRDEGFDDETRESLTRQESMESGGRGLSAGKKPVWVA